MDEGKTLLEHLLDNSTKCYSQLDCGWAQNGGCYPPSFIRRYKNRFVAIHVKENSKVQGPGPRPASRHAAEEAGRANPFANVKEMPLEERQKILDGFNAHMNSPEGKKRFAVQCPMGAPESNMNWQDIKDALDEQDFEAFWVVEREGFYDEHDKCIADDARWIDLDAVRLRHFCHFVELVRDFDGFCLVTERRACPDDGLAAELGNLFNSLFCRLCVDGDNLKAGLFQPFFDVLNVVIEVDRQQLDARKAEGRDGLELIEQRGPEAEIARDAAKGICTDVNFHVKLPQS